MRSFAEAQALYARPMHAAASPAVRGQSAAAGMLLTFIVTVAVFAPAVHNDFVNYDDHAYVLKNPHVRAGLCADGLVWAFTTTSMSNYHPLTWLSHMLDVSLFGLDPAAHHAVSVFWHGTNAALAFLLMLRLCRRLDVAAAVALCFALHPLRVESVAWISERKDLLSAFFFLLCLHFFVSWHRDGGRLFWWLSWLACLIGLLCKPMIVTVAPLLVVLELLVLSDAPRVDSLRLAALRLLPFFLLSVAFSVLTVHTQSDALMDSDRYPLVDRVAAAAVNLCRYLQLTIWPRGLAAVHPLLPGGYPATQVLCACVVLVVVTGIVVVARRRQPLMLAGWLWFVGMLVPVLGLLQAGRAAIAERYSYLPHLGLFLALAVAARAAHPRGTIVLMVLCAGVVPATEDAIRMWRDSRTLFAASLESEPKSAFAHDALAGALLEASEREAAIRHARTAVELASDVPQYTERLAQALAVSGKNVEAEALLRGVLARHPDRGSARFALSALLHQDGREDEARAELRRALEDAEAALDEELIRRIRPIAERALHDPQP